jgi:hypothetical protein
VTFRRASGSGRSSSRLTVEGAVLKGIGVVAGVPDLILIDQARVYALELKGDGNKRMPVLAEIGHSLFRNRSPHALVWSTNCNEAAN